MHHVLRMWSRAAAKAGCACRPPAIGNMMIIASSNIDVPLVFAGLFILAFMGIALYAAFALLEQRMTGWAMRKSEFVN